MKYNPTDALRWAVDTFGLVAIEERERAMRFLEEAVELAHALDLDRATIDAIVKRVFSRNKGYIPREIGQAHMTLECLAEALGHCSEREAATEFDRVRAIPRAEWQRRHAEKAKIGIAL